MTHISFLIIATALFDDWYLLNFLRFLIASGMEKSLDITQIDKYAKSGQVG